MGELTKKNAKKRRRRRKRAEAEAAEGASPPSKSGRKKRPRRKKPAPSSGDSASSEDSASKDWGRYVWPVLLVVGLVELWMFGRRGHIEVCVAKDGVHDFALLGQTRTDDNTRQFPTCETRFNLGITSDYDDLLQTAMLQACHRANILRGKEATLICAIKEDGWQHRVTETHCPPWHEHYYKRMFWFLQD